MGCLGVFKGKNAGWREDFKDKMWGCPLKRLDRVVILDAVRTLGRNHCLNNNMHAGFQCDLAHYCVEEAFQPLDRPLQRMDPLPRTTTCDARPLYGVLQLHSPSSACDTIPPTLPYPASVDLGILPRYVY
jgi:hypothetical protein